MTNSTKPARNIEIKAIVSDPQAVTATAERLATSSRQQLRQVDTYFHCPQGRLKLREIWTPEDAPPQPAAIDSGPDSEETLPHRVELIWYERPDQAGPKTSNYVLAPLTSPAAAVKLALAAAWGVRAVVDKLRTVWFWHNVRIHWDQVANLGDFLEFEAVLAEDMRLEEGQEQVRTLMREFELSPDSLLEGSYIDLLEALSVTLPPPAE